MDATTDRPTRLQRCSDVKLERTKRLSAAQADGLQYKRKCVILLRELSRSTVAITRRRRQGATDDLSTTTRNRVEECNLPVEDPAIISSNQFRNDSVKAGRSFPASIGTWRTKLCRSLSRRRRCRSPGENKTHESPAPPSRTLSVKLACEPPLISAQALKRRSIDHAALRCSHSLSCPRKEGFSPEPGIVGRFISRSSNSFRKSR